VRGIVCVDQLRQAQGAGHARRAATDNHNVGFHLRTFDAFNGFTKVDHEEELGSSFGFLDLFNQRRHHIKQVGNHTNVGNLENRCFGIFIDGDNDA
jgi:hypothetical protein